MSSSSAFQRIAATLRDQSSYPLNLQNLVPVSHRHRRTPPREAMLVAIERRAEDAVREARRRLGKQDAETIILMILPNLQPVQNTVTRWVPQPGSGGLRAEQVTERDGPHSVLLSQLVTRREAAIYRPGSKHPDLFQRLICARLLRNTRPKLSLLQLITFALIALGGIADEAEIQGWLLANIAFFRFTPDLDRDIRRVLTRVFNSNDRVLEPVDPAVRNRGADYNRQQQGLVWKLPIGNEHRVFQEYYAPGHNLFWNRPRPFLETQNLLKESRATAIAGREPPKGGHFPRLDAMPAELLTKIAQELVVTDETIYAEVDNHGGLSLFVRAPPETVAPREVLFFNEPSGHEDREAKRQVPLEWVLSLCEIPKLGAHIREHFFGSNHFNLRHSATGETFAMHREHEDGPISDYVPWRFLHDIGTSNADFLTSVSAEAFVDPLGEGGAEYGHRYRDQTVNSLERLRLCSRLRNLELEVNYNEVDDRHSIDWRSMRVYQLVEDLREAVPGFEPDYNDDMP